MAWVAVDKNGLEYIYVIKPYRGGITWCVAERESCLVMLPEGSIEKLIGRKLTWNDEPVELK